MALTESYKPMNIETYAFFLNSFSFCVEIEHYVLLCTTALLFA